MLVSCILPTFNRRRFVPQAIRCFLAQDYADRELIVVDDGDDSVADLIPVDARIHYLRQAKRLPVGVKRNLACEAAQGELIVHWDDDDWSAPWRVGYQAEQLRNASADLCGLDRVLFYAPEENRAWAYAYPPTQRPWVYGASLCYTRAFWQKHRFPDISVGEDNRFVWKAAQGRIHRATDSRFLVAVIHGANTSRKQTVDRRYQPHDVAAIEELLGEAKPFYRALRAGPSDLPSPTRPSRVAGACVNAGPARSSSSRHEGSTAPALAKPRALVAAALGIGDILRVTPMIRAASQLGYEVDVLLSTDYAESAALLEGTSDVHAVYAIPSARSRGSATAHAGDEEELPLAIRETNYDVALFTAWGASLRRSVRAKRILTFDRKAWLAEGDFRSGERLARELGWREQMPTPFAVASSRRFNLLAGTVALHPGCKAEWPWKKWHGFAELAALFPHVVVVGTSEDLRVDGTYFLRNYDWPPHVRDFVGRLSLSDTAALLKECAAVVSNDSGIMHLATALGCPTFGIFGITSPIREGVPAKNFHPITKGLSCEGACHHGTWGRRDCEHHLACLKTLTPEEVFMKVTDVVPSTRGAAAVTLEIEARSHSHRTLDRPIPKRSRDSEPNSTAQAANGVKSSSPETSVRPDPGETIQLAYYGYVFDASGYGNAARAYLHALHIAGIQLSVIDLANHGRQVRDPLIESLVNRRIDADFHLFHGIPPQWARRAFPLNNVIAMTVWETDVMPSTWRPALNHATQVWLPCDYNVAAFAPALSRPVVKVPHAWRPSLAVPANDWIAQCGAREGDFVFYSIFEWQERKGPAEMIEAFLRAFPDAATPVALILKTNHGAAGLAAKTLAEVRQRVRSEARIELRAEAWSEEQVAALNELGDAYVSLHHGEGWNYPLFEAAARGKSVVATGFSGPMEYLDPAVHKLVRHQPAPVRQRYAYYSTAMHWAEPDVNHAVECLRAVFEQRDQPDDARRVSAERIRNAYSLQTVGETARRHLHELLRRSNPVKWQRLETAARLAISRPPLPIRGDWYDADYFEYGRKSNWTEGYTWPAFAGLFRDTAEFLTDTFPEAETYLDAGCAKGFLVRTLRERSKEAWGIDHSPWALSHAEESARPFLQLARVEEAEHERTYDVVLALFLLDSLTETQALAFLERTRAHTRQALVCVIATCETDTQRIRFEREDRDLSHVTLHGRRWWTELFLRAGWRQDALHRLAERACRNHALPQRMGWELFVFSPV